MGGLFDRGAGQDNLGGTSRPVTDWTGSPSSQRLCAVIALLVLSQPRSRVAWAKPDVAWVSRLGLNERTPVRRPGFFRFACARGDLNPHALSDTGT